MRINRIFPSKIFHLSRRTNIRIIAKFCYYTILYSVYTKRIPADNWAVKNGETWHGIFHFLAIMDWSVSVCIAQSVCVSIFHSFRFFFHLSQENRFSCKLRMLFVNNRFEAADVKISKRNSLSFCKYAKIFFFVSFDSIQNATVQHPHMMRVLVWKVVTNVKENKMWKIHIFFS